MHGYAMMVIWEHARTPHIILIQIDAITLGEHIFHYFPVNIYFLIKTISLIIVW